MRKNMVFSMLIVFCSTLFLLTFFSGGLYILDKFARNNTAVATEVQERKISKKYFATLKKETRLKETKIASSSHESNSPEPIKIAFAGDVMFGSSNEKAMKDYGIDYPFIQVHKELNDADYAIVNLETAVTNRGVPEDKQYIFRTGNHSLKALKQAGFDMVSLANNHTMDYGQKGLLDTIDYIEDEELEFVGAGRNSDEAYAAKIIKIKDKQIAILGFSRILPDVSWYAGASKPGIASGYQLERMLKIIEETKQGVDYVFVFMHWGIERKQTPERYQVDSARALIDSGADGIIGAHTHVTQSLDYYNGKPIAYSLGNFYFPDYVSGLTAESSVLTLIIEDDNIQMKLTPYEIRGNQVAALTEQEQESRLQKLEDLSWNVKREGNFFLKNEQ